MPNRADAVAKLAYLFRAERRSRPVILLGAGASYRSGVPLADEIVKQIARKAFARQVRGMDDSRCTVLPTDWIPFLQRQPWFVPGPAPLAVNFPCAIEHLLTPQQVRREFLLDAVGPRNGISEGYHSLARLLYKKLCLTVLTTNFDSLIVDALRDHKPRPLEIVEVNKTQDDLIGFSANNRCQVVYLHGRVEFYRDKNLLTETQRLDDKLVHRIRPVLLESPLIVVGYRGAEPSVMHHLLLEGADDSYNYPSGIYWCIRGNEEPHEHVRQLQTKIGTNFSLVRIDGFDELLIGLDQALVNDVWYTSAEISLPASGTHQKAATSPDLSPIKNVTLESLDHELILATFAEYCTRLKIPPLTKDNYLSFLEEQGYLVREDDVLRPTLGCFLLFGRNVQDRLPFSCVACTRDGKKRTVVGGNLVSQYRNLLALLESSEANPILRVKGERDSTEQQAYPTRALSEIVVNLLVHRDYSIDDYSRIDQATGESLTFTSPGGLVESVKNKINVDASRRFAPIRGLTELRNPLLADVFYGIGPMDKAGTGLADVIELMQEAGGLAEYSVLVDNIGVQIRLKQALQSTPAQSVARRVVPTDLYITNLLPFRVLPSQVFALPLREEELTAPLFFEDEDPTSFPVFIRNSAYLMSFADLRQYPDFSDRRGFLNYIEQWDVADLLGSDRQYFLSWLLKHHWEIFLKTFPLIVEARQRRAYFRLTETDRTEIRYSSRTGRNVSRDVVKRRGEDSHISYENEAILYSIVRFLGEWAIQIRPSYVFTQLDAITPLPGLIHSKRSTRRFKFDRNKNVDDDLTFWSRYLSHALPTINLGGPGVMDLILDSEFCSAEVPVTREDEIASANAN